VRHDTNHEAASTTPTAVLTLVRKSLATRVKEACAAAGATYEPCTENGRLMAKINGVPMLHAEALEKLRWHDLAEIFEKAFNEKGEN
jgi:hypothetical protein